MTETLSERVARLRAEADRVVEQQRKRAYQSAPARAGRDIAGAAWFFTGVGIGLFWIWENIVRPLWRKARRPIVWTYRAYVSFWDKVVIVPDPYGKPVFSKTRAGLMVIATAIFWFILLGPLISVIADATIYALTAEVDERVILLSSQPLNDERNTHQVTGCTELPCAGNPLYFLVRASLFNDLWTIAHLQGFSFYPDMVAAPIPMDVSECVITSYGLRRNFLWLRMFPEILAVRSCNVVAATAKQRD